MISTLFHVGSNQLRKMVLIIFMVIYNFQNGRIHAKPKVYNRIVNTHYMIQVRVHTTY